MKISPYKTIAVAAFIVAMLGTNSRLDADTAAVVAAQTQAAINKGSTPKWWSPSLPEDVQRDVDNKGKRLAEKLELGDDVKTRQVSALITEHFARVWAWHQEVDEKLDAGWAAWDAARTPSESQPKDELKALAIMTERIDPIYAEFAPQIQRFLKAMHQAVGEKKTTALLDRITRSLGAPRTYNAYVGIVPEMSESEKAVLWKRMAQAREDSLAAWSDKRNIKIFKKHKVRNEFSIDYFGYGYRKRYEAWVKAKR